ncbi:MAG: J domain-containing protein, partial [Nitrospinae bacterium]|nr:J domain-containing protein [Nitrospinota bacterium]
MRTSTDKNYYTILGVARNATAETIKKQFRKLAREHHPDTNAGNKKSEDKFKIIAEAYEILGDEKKRQAYDRQTPQGQPRRQRTSSRRRRSQRDEKARYGYGFSESGKQSEYREPFTESEFQEEASIDPDFPTRGIDLQYMIDVPLVTAALGGKLPLAYEKFVNCGDCRGSGTENGLDCPACQGKGQTVGQLSLDIDIPPGIVDQYTLQGDLFSEAIRQDQAVPTPLTDAVNNMKGI